MKHVCYLIISIIIYGCSNEINVDQLPYNSKIVVDGWIENNDFAYITLTRSTPFLTNYDSASIRNTFLNYAKVTITTGNGDSEILTLTRRDEFFPPFVYKTIRIKGEVGQTYHLKVEVSGHTIESTTRIPPPPDITYVKPQIISDTTYIIEAEINDPLSIPNQYYIQININNIDTRFHPSVFPVFSDATFDGQSKKVKIYRSNQPDPLHLNPNLDDRNLPTSEFAGTDTVFVKISSIDSTSFHVLNAIYLDHLSQENPFSFIEKKTTTNINGGIGRWTGLNSKNYLVYYNYY